MTLHEHEGLPDRTTAKQFYSKYEPKEVLGRGISSVVRRCVEKQTGRAYAVKIIDISGQLPDAAETEETTMREIQLLRMINGHKYIIELHDVFFELPTYMFLIFELCKSGELFDFLTKVVTLSEKKTRTIMKQLLEAVAFIHSKNIVHRDLKPENILLDDAGDVKLTDFGFATILQDGETMTDLCGTPGYLAPEVLRASMYDDVTGYGQPVDMWACGVIMYTLLVGCPPFWHRRQMVMLRSIMEAKYTFGPEWDDISDPPKDLIRRLLVVDTSTRLTATQALDHEFFQIQPQLQLDPGISSVLLKKVAEEKLFRPFDARRMWKVGILCARAMTRIQRMHMLPRPISAELVRNDPYRVKVMRKIIDGCAFGIYGHWVKRGEGQNRAALFEGTPKFDLMQALREDEVDESDVFAWSRFY